LTSRSSQKTVGRTQVSKWLLKICLNSLWGKFAQNPALESYEFISNYETFLKRILDQNTRN
jgi:hypothetical protein